jgi:uncharacterized membrane protein YhfC
MIKNDLVIFKKAIDTGNFIVYLQNNLTCLQLEMKKILVSFSPNFQENDKAFLRPHVNNCIIF